MRQRFFIQSIIILLLIAFWQFINIAYIVGVSKGFTESSRTSVNLFSNDKQTLIDFAKGLNSIQKSNSKPIDLTSIKKLSKSLSANNEFFSSVDSTLDFLLLLQNLPVYSKMTIKTNQELTQELAKKYNLTYEEFVNKAVNTLPHMLTIEIDIEQVSNFDNRGEYEKLFNKYLKQISFEPDFTQIKKKIGQGVAINNFFYILNSVIALFVFLFIFFQRLFFEKANIRQWEVYKSLGYSLSYRKRKYFQTTFIFSLYPLVFYILFLVGFFGFGFAELFSLSFSLVVKLFVLVPIFEFFVILFSNLLTGFFVER